MADKVELWKFGEEEEKPKITTVNPAGSIWDIGKAIVESDIPSRVYEAIPESVIQGAKVAGSKVMDVLNVIDKPRGALAGIWDVIGESGDKLVRNPDTGGYEFVHQEPRSVLDDASLTERLKQGAREGWKDPHSKSFGDEFTSLLPEAVSDVPGTKFTTDVAANILGDPLTYTPGAVVSVPYRLFISALRRPATAVAKFGPVRTVLEAFNVHVGDAAKAQKIINDLRLEQRGEDILATREKAELEDTLAEIALRAGVSVPELKSALTEAIETGDVGLVAKHGADAVKFADNEVQFYRDILAAEQAAGRTTEDILERAGELGIGGYMPHVKGSASDTFNRRVSKILSGKISPEYRRELEGTIKEINERMGRQFFLDDPLVLHAMRRRWSNQALESERMFTKAKVHGKEIDPKNPGFDIHGNPIPDEWLKLRGHAFPPDFHRIISKQNEILTDPRRFKSYLKYYDTVLNWWKKYSLASRPAWHTRNAFGNIWNAYLIGGLTDAKRYGQAAAIQKAMQVGKGKIVGQTDLIVGKVTGKTVDPKAIVPGTGLTREELFNEAIKRGGYESGMYGQDVGEAAIRQSRIPGHTDWSGINKAFAAGKTVENNARLALFIDGIAKGIKSASKGGPVDAQRILDAAAMNVRRSLFDYGDLSAFEKTVMKRAAPFYTWTRKNLPAQLRAVAEHPDRANKMNILIAGLQRDVGKVDSNDVEQWVKNQFPIFLSADDSEDTYTFITAMSYLPTAELNRIFQSPKNVAEMVAQMGSPLLKLPFEFLTNYDTFRHKKIDPSQKGMGIGKFGEGFFVNPSKGSQDFLGIKVTPKQRHLLQSLVLLGEIDRLNPFNIFGEREEGTKSWAGATRHGRDILESSRWIRAGLGVRVYKRGKGEARTKKVFGLMSDIKYLEQKLQEPKAIMNEELRQHLLRQMLEIQQGGVGD